jgi:hypothetical protein
MGKILPSMKVIEREQPIDYDDNAVIQKHLIVYGRQGSGKTAMVKRIVELVVEKYGIDNVNVKISKSLEELLSLGMDNKKVQILIGEDVSYRYADMTKEHKKLFNDFFQIRHIYKELTGNSNGLVITILTLHRYFSIKPALRTDFDLLVVKNPPSNPYDNRMFSNWLGSGAMDELQHQYNNWDKSPKAKGVFGYIMGNNSGIAIYKLAETDYTLDVVEKIGEEQDGLPFELSEKLKDLEFEYYIKVNTLPEEKTKGVIDYIVQLAKGFPKLIIAFFIFITVLGIILWL